MAELHTPSLLLESAIYLGAAVLAVPIFRRIGLGSVLGYLFAGVIIGPWVLGLVADTETVMHFSEFGVVMMLFLIGLEIEPDKLLELRLPIFGMGGLQVIATGGIVFGLGVAFNLDWRLALVAGMGVAMSSTAIAMQILSEQGALNRPAGRSAFSVLLFQDLAVIPLMVLLLVIAPGAHTSNGVHMDWLAILKAVSLIVLLVLGGKYLLRPVLRYVANTGLREIFIAFALFLIIGVSILMTLVGLSMALGAFIAGVMLADSEYRQELELDIEPFKGLLLGLFFISVGMSVNLDMVMQQPWLILGLAGAFVAFKLLLLFGLAKGFKLQNGDSMMFALTLSQVGEFAFVIFSAAVDAEVISYEHSALLNSVVALSMVTTPLLLLAFNVAYRKRLNSRRKHATHDEFDEERPVIVAGFGRVGQIITRLLTGVGVVPTVIEHDPNQIEFMRSFGYHPYYGDITRPDVLRAAGIARAKLLILAIDDAQEALETARYVRKHYPEVKILARARNRTYAFDYMDLEIDAVRETFLGAVHLGEKALQEMGYSPFQAYRTAWKFRQHDEKMMRDIHPIHADMQKVVSHSVRTRQDLAHTLEQEMNSPVSGHHNTAWEGDTKPS
ncbi:monovalent cation:proton antiporter-2 (CPA2) family protein [Methylobacillus gramineus]|uniref:monovalent cation:proton antiporter-2 (CPA2) family protein n=1 Tax=Methylobacillus gramineus TaxID=755169 RepID=UPI001CFF5DA5|nr:monovalent cation:proton antiporter-2 (CPA2) family protein [Methylobacillus gramineus]MCB5186084.1 monovalent cation:proton antiporter-2 (CPA2) family protein [Methylobacillus gramineus]